MSWRLAFLVVAVMFAAACGAAGLSISPNPNVDPLGDAGSAPTFDITETRSVRVPATPPATAIEFSITTTPAPDLPAPGSFTAATEMAFLIGFDTDLNTGTGLPMGGVCGGGQGLDFAVIGGGAVYPRNGDGSFVILDAATGFVTGNASVSGEGGSTITLTVPLLALGGDDGSTYSVTFVTLDADTDGRDCSPNASSVMPTRLGERTLLQFLRK